MAYQYTQEELLLIIGDEVQKNETLSPEDLIQKLFQQNVSFISTQLSSFIHKEIFKNHKFHCRFLIKNQLIEKIKVGSSDFIKSFIQLRKSNEIIEIFYDNSSLYRRLKFLEEHNCIGSLMIECSRLFDGLKEKFASSENETKMRTFLLTWFRNSFMSLQAFNLLMKWNLQTLSLDGFKKLLKSMKNDSNAKTMLKMANSIKTDNFVEPQKNKDILEIFHRDPIIECIDGIIKVKGHLIFLSLVKTEIENLTKDSVKHVAIFAEDAFIFDCDLNSNFWNGMNFSINSNKINVIGNCKIVLSGISYNPGNSKAKNSTDILFNGEKGTDGVAGESSGNIVILTKKFFNPENLTCELNGGRGQDGGDGGDGCDGANGAGIKQTEISSLLPSYTSLLRNPWSQFDYFLPPTNWKSIEENSSWGNYILRKYKDENGRIMTYSFCADIGRIYTTYELYFIIEGSNGTIGSMGGSNGVGGEGGYRGTHIIQNPETGEFFNVNVIRNAGQSGVNGKIGKSGKIGINGNDLAIIDRSAFQASKFNRGDEGCKLQTSYVYEAQKFSRLNGHLRYKCDKESCFIKFDNGEKIDTTERRAERAPQRTIRERQSKAVAKASIFVDELIDEASKIFGQDNAFLADACEDTADFAKETAAEEEGEEEAAENVNEEVVFLRQKVDAPKISNFTFDNEKIKRPIYTPEEFVKYFKTLRHQRSCGKTAQFIFDLFTIELNPDQMCSISIPSLFHQSDFREALKSSFIKVLIAAQQSQIVDGKSWTEIEEFSKDFIPRRLKKQDTTALRKRLENFVEHFDAEITEYEKDIAIGDKILIGVKPGELSKLLQKYNDPKAIENVTEAFFRNYTNCKIDDELMEEMTKLLKQIEQNPDALKLLELFKKDGLKWTNYEACEKYISYLTAWHKEEKELRKAEKEKGKSTKMMRSKTEEEANFQHFLDSIVKNHEFWSELIKQSATLISASNDYIARFGDPPVLEDGLTAAAKAKYTSLKNWAQSKSVTSKDIALASYSIKLYYLAKEILSFQMQIYNLNLIMDFEKKDKLDQLKLVSRFEDLIFQRKQYPLPTETAECQEFMQKQGLKCSAYRNLLADSLNIRISTYKEKGFQTLELFEDLNPAAKNCEIIWQQNDKSVAGVSVDSNFRDLIKTQQNFVQKYQNLLETEFSAYFQKKIKTAAEIQKLADFYPAPLQTSVIQWIQNYLAIFDDMDDRLLPLLYNRFYIDGCHLSVFELQYILSSVSRLHQIYHCSMDYILLLLSSVSQKEFIDVIGYTRIQYHHGGRFKPASKIFSGLSLIPSKKYKGLLTSKLDEYSKDISEEDLYKVILTLQHASNGSEQLFKTDMSEWIEIAQKQKWNEVNSLLKKYGSIGYYLGVLNNYGLFEEEKRMQEIFDKAVIIPEKFIAFFTNIIITEGIDDEIFFDNIEKILKLCDDFPEMQEDTTAKPQIVTDEIGQTRLMNWMKNKQLSDEPVGMQEFFSTEKNDRSIDEVVAKITGLTDSVEEKKKRQESLIKIGKLLEFGNMDNENLKYLKQFDDALFKLFEKRLWNTQKMAIMCVLESEKNVLEQVHTGEGKTFIIAAIAAIRCKTGHRFVDIITSSPVFAHRDAERMRKLYATMGLTVGDNCSEDLEERKKAYSCDIVYGDIARFQRDYLLHTFYKKPILGDRFRDAVIVDEVDNMILDNSNNMLYLSHNVPGMDLLDSLLIFIQQQIFSPIYSGDKNKIEELQAKFDNSEIEQKILEDLFGHFSMEDLTTIIRGQLSKQKTQDIYDKLISEKIIDKNGYLCIYQKEQIEDIAKALALFSKDIVIKIQACFQIILCRERQIELPAYLRPFAKLHLNTLIENCKHAFFLEADTGYVIDVDHTGKLQSSLEPIVTIIDSNTGADLANSQWTGGLHQFLQLKHGCRFSPMSLKAVFMSNVSYLKDYIRMNGLSGTLGSAEESQTLIDIYGVDLIKIPTNKPKIFYEHVPKIATKSDEWIKNIFDAICDQVIVQRSVLVICEDIQQLNEIENGIMALFQKEKNPNKFVNECFSKMTVYKREHDEFNFEDEKSKFETSQLIIATNLAGRGTDIKLSEKLINNGGLHVITAFMPKNRRIEEQAFGRAARCGQPGSAQIIALAEPVENSIEPSIFQLKTYRDNAEVHRLQTLKKFYDFHTDIEEKCLNKFREYCEKVLATAYSVSSSASKTGESLPSINQVIYFTLLDLWALWLDAKSPEIAQCSKEGSKETKQQRKQEIIDSVDTFLKEHPYQNFEEAKKWIKNPQALLTIGIIQMYHKNGFADADETFDSVLKEGHEFGGEAEYYKGCMRMQGFKSMRSSTNELKIINPKPFEKCIESAAEHFTKSRTLFQNRLSRKQREAGIIAKLIEKAPDKNPKTCGFASQIKAATKNIGLILSNIDNLLGNPCDEKMFMNDKIDERYSKLIFDAMFRQGIIGPELLCGYNLEEWQLKPFKDKYKFQRKQLNALIDSISHDSQCQTFDDKIVLDKWQLFEKAELSSRGEFWAEMEQQKAFYNTELFFAVTDKNKISKNLALKIFDELQPFVIPQKDLRFKVRYSSEKEMDILYKAKAVNDLIADDKELKAEMQKSIDNGHIKLEKISNILITHDSMSFFTKFDGIVLDDFKEFFNLNYNGARWILNTLRDAGSLELQRIEMTRCTLNKELWEKLVRIHLPSDAIFSNENEEIGKKMLFKNAGTLQQLKNDKNLLNITPEVLEYFCDLKIENDKMKDAMDSSLSAQTFFDYLKEKEILEPYIYEIYRINSKLDCSKLPHCISQKIDEFLSDRFAYSFALEDLCHSIEATYDHPNSQPHQIFLPENPFTDIFEYFIEAGLAVPKRITTKIEELEYFDFEDFQHPEEIKQIIYANRPKLDDLTYYHFEMIPLATFALNQNFQVDSDLRAIIDNGLKVVVAKKEEKGNSWMTKKIIATASFCWNKIKSAATACANFGYSVVKFCCQLPGKVFGAISDDIGPYVKEAGNFIIKLAKPLMDSSLGQAIGEVGKDAFNVCKEVIIDCAYAALKVAEGTIKYTKKAGKYVYTKSGEVVEWIGNTEIVKGTKEIFNGGAIVAGKAINWAKTSAIWKTAAEKATYLFTKMSEFCTAVSESYQYYNQCRTRSRQLVLENHSMIDEHSILVTFNGITKEETKKRKKENDNVKKLQQFIEDQRPVILAQIEALIDKSINSHEPISPSILKKLISTSFSIKKFKSEFDSLLKFVAWQKQNECYNILKECNENDRNNFPPSFIDSENLYFLEDAIEEIFEELEKLSDDDGYESDQFKETSAENTQNLQEILMDYTKSAIQVYFIDPTVSLVLAYYCSMVDEEFSPSTSDAYLNAQDKDLKQALADYNQSNILKQNSEFLSKELLNTIHHCLKSQPLNCVLLKQSIKYGYPLPIYVAPKIAETINQWLSSSKIYQSGLLLEIYDEKDQNLKLISKKFGDGKAKLILRPLNGHLFISQSDYHIFAKINDAGLEDSCEKAFIYEGLIGYLKTIKSHFPKQGESLREILLCHI